MNYFRCGGGRSTHTATKIDVAKTPLAVFESNVSGLYIPEILAYIQASQSGSGDPSPSNPRAITGWSAVNVARTGVNVWDEEWEVGYISVLDGTNSNSQINIRSKNYIPIKPNVSLYLKANIATVYCPVIFYDRDKNFLSSIAQALWNRTITTPENAYYMRFYMHDSYGTTYNNDISINYPATDTAYHAYTGTTATINLGGTYYGGYLNVPTGLLTVTWGSVDLGSLRWALQVNHRFQAYNSIYAKPSGDYDVPVNCLCSEYVTRTQNQVYNSYTGIAIHALNGQSIYVYDTRFDDAATFKPAINGVQLVYELATPQTYQLTPAQIEQLLQNNVFCSSGDVAVKYWKID